MKRGAECNLSSYPCAEEAVNEDDLNEEDYEKLMRERTKRKFEDVVAASAPKSEKCVRATSQISSPCFSLQVSASARSCLPSTLFCIRAGLALDRVFGRF